MSRLGLRALLQGLLEADDQIHGPTPGASVLTLVRRFSTLQESARTMREGIQSLKEQLTAAECSIAKQGEVHREKVARLEAQLASVIAASNRAQFDLAEARERLAAQTNPATEEAVCLYIMRNMGLDSTPNESLLDLIKAVNKVHVRECASFRDDSLKAQQDAQQWRDWARPLWPEGPPNPSDAALRDAIGARMLKGIAHPLNDALAALRKVLPEGLHDEPSRARTASCMIFDAAAYFRRRIEEENADAAETRRAYADTRDLLNKATSALGKALRERDEARAGWAEQSQAAAQARTERDAARDVADAFAQQVRDTLDAQARALAERDALRAKVETLHSQVTTPVSIEAANKRPQPGDQVAWSEVEDGCLYADTIGDGFLALHDGRFQWVWGSDSRMLPPELWERPDEVDGGAHGEYGEEGPHAILVARGLGSDPEQWREAMRAYLQAKGNPTP